MQVTEGVPDWVAVAEGVAVGVVEGEAPVLMVAVGVPVGVALPEGVGVGVGVELGDAGRKTSHFHSVEQSLKLELWHTAMTQHGAVEQYPP